MDTSLTASFSSDDALDAVATARLRQPGFGAPEHAWPMLRQLRRRAAGLLPSHNPLPSLFDAVAASCDPERGLKNLYALLTRSGDAPAAALFRIIERKPDAREALVTLCAASPFLSGMMIRDPEFIASLLSGDGWRTLRSRDDVDYSLKAAMDGMTAVEETMVTLRRFKRREYLRIALCDLLKRAPTPEVLRSLSDVADLCLRGAYDACTRHLRQRHGAPPAMPDGTPCAFAVIGMGKLGGRELNFSSDIDLLYVYSSTRGVTARTRVSAYAYYPKLARMITDVLSRITSNGFVFRVDLRLRPEGKAGDIAHSIDGYRRHYASFGQTWERQALIKARPVAGSPEVGRRFLETIRPFVFHPESDPLILDDINRMRRKIARALLERGVGKYHVKLGPGGIREIEFILQAFQLIHGGAQAWPWERSTLETLSRVADRGYLTGDEATDLHAAYLFLRDLENRIQMMTGRQTHEIPAEVHEQAVLARVMGLQEDTAAGAAGLLRARYRTHTRRVRQVYARVFHSAM